MNIQRDKWSKYYNEILAGIGDVEISTRKEYMKPAYHNYVIKTAYRDELQEYMKLEYISTGMHYYRELPATETIREKLMTLPLYRSMTEEEVNMIINEFKGFFTK